MSSTGFFHDPLPVYTRVKDDGRAEAALIAWWHWRHGTQAGEQSRRAS